VRAAVTLATSRTPASARRSSQTLERGFGKEVIPTFTVDPELLGGVVMRIGGEVLDGSCGRGGGAAAAARRGAAA
jgi:F-type H+-transporting ATPase subunit delta